MAAGAQERAEQPMTVSERLKWMCWPKITTDWHPVQEKTLVLSA